MKHKNIYNKLIFFHEGELTSSEEKDVKEHLTECIECRDFLEVLKNGFSVIENEKNPEISPYFYSKLKAKIENQAKPENESILIKILQPVVFSTLLIIGIGFGISMGAKIKTNKPKHTSISETYHLNEMDSEPIESYFIN